MNDIKKIKQTILETHGYSYWLKKALAELDDRDPVDAYKDLKTLELFFHLKLENIKKQLSGKGVTVNEKK